MNINKIIVILVILVVILLAPCSASQLEDNYQQGLSRYSSGDTYGALASWAKVINTKPDSDTTQSKMLVALLSVVSDLASKITKLESNSTENTTSTPNSMHEIIYTKKMVVAGDIVAKRIIVQDKVFLDNPSYPYTVLFSGGLHLNSDYGGVYLFSGADSTENKPDVPAIMIKNKSDSVSVILGVLDKDTAVLSLKGTNEESYVRFSDSTK